MYHTFVVSWLQDMENKKASEAQLPPVQESTEDVQQQLDVEKTKCEDDQSDKSQSRGSLFIVHV